MNPNSESRDVALKILYQTEFLNVDLHDQMKVYKETYQPSEKIWGFVCDLCLGVEDKRQEIDEILQSAADNWKLDRMNGIDRNILRMALFEMLYQDTPNKVVLNEAIEFAKKYGAEQSSSFVNGILDKIAKERDLIE